MKIGVFKYGWWDEACKAVSQEKIDLPIARHADDNAYTADLASRIDHGTATLARLQGKPVDLFLDNGGAGLGFTRGPGGGDDLKIAHEVAGKPLLSHFIDPLTTAFQGLEWQVVWQCLQSQTWFKAVWDRAHVVELQQFGLPHVLYLPMAAVDHPYDTNPLDGRNTQPIVSFVGGQNTTYFSSNAAVPSSTLLAGAMAHAARSDLPGLSFYDLYHNFYGLGALPVDGEELTARIHKVTAYLNAKLFFNATMCLRNRDRFVIFLKRQFGERFHLAGKGWDSAYGLPTAPRFETRDDYLKHFRNVAINLNFVNGNAETGLNMRHFEITAAGGFMLCYQQPELGELFEIGKECAVFTSEADLLDKINYYLDRPQERADIALAGQRRTLSQHLYSHRLRTFKQLVLPAPLPVDYSTSNLWDDLEAIVPKARVILDCGANVGQMARGFRQAYPDAQIYCFEPVSSVFEELRAECDRVVAVPVKKAVFDRNGTATIHLTAGAEAHSLLGFEAGNPCARWTKEVGEEAVEVCTLDHWCHEEDIDGRQVDILKLDVQGAELQALYGAKKLLQDVRVVYLEVSFVPIYKDCPLFGEVDAFLSARGFRRCAVYPSDQPQNWGDALYVNNRERSPS